MRTVNGCILLLAAISITFAAVRGLIISIYSNCWRSFFVRKMFLCRNKLSSGKSAYRVFLLRCFWARRWQGPEPPIRECSVIADVTRIFLGARRCRDCACGNLWGLSIVYIQLYAFCGGLMVVAGVWLITRRVTRHDPILTLVLVGIALGTLCGAGISLIKTLADPYTSCKNQLPSGCWGGCPP